MNVWNDFAKMLSKIFGFAKISCSTIICLANQLISSFVTYFTLLMLHMSQKAVNGIHNFNYCHFLCCVCSQLRLLVSFPLKITHFIEDKLIQNIVLSTQSKYYLLNKRRLHGFEHANEVNRHFKNKCEKKFRV